MRTPRLSEVPWLLLAWSADRSLIEGCDVRVAAASDEELADVRSKVADALRLIAERGPRFHIRIVRDVRRFLFAGVSGGRYIAGLQTCLIGVGYARRVPAIELAMTMIHEATHARLSRAGFRYRAACRERIERVCVAQEIAFAQRVPGSASAIDGVRQLLETKWWRTEERLEADTSELKTRGVPAWLINVLRWWWRKTGSD